MSDTAWMERAACRGMDPEMFFPDRGAEDQARAKAICAQCPVSTYCKAHAEAVGAQHGVWGGSTRTARRPKPQKKGEYAAHGTPRGYSWHMRRQEKACAPCQCAHAAHCAAYYRKRRASAAS